MMSSFDEVFERANKALAQNRLDEAGRLCAELRRRAPADPRGRFLEAVVHARSGHAADALPLLERLAAEEPGFAPVWLWLSRVQRSRGEFHLAVRAATIAADLLPQDATIALQLGLAQFDVGDADSAATAFGKVLTLVPDHPAALTGLWSASMALDHAETAIECAHALVAREPASAEAHLRLAQALTVDNRLVLAEEHVREAMRLAPASPLSHLLLGTILQGLGQIAAALEEFQRSIALQPVQGAAYASLVYGRKAEPSDRELLGTLRDLASREPLPPAESSQLQFAIGRLSEGAGDFEGAMRHFDLAHRWIVQGKRDGRPFDREGYARQIQALQAAFERPLPPSNPAAEGDGGPVPILVVGMIRSGTTLVEQILTSHSKVGSAGEQRFWLEVGRRASEPKGERMGEERRKELARAYRARLAELCPGAAYVVDKMPDNYLELPIIRSAVPYAKILHVVRDPVDTCLSIYTTPNRLGNDWSHTKADLAFVYQQYQTLMKRWTELLGPEAIHEVRYEELVRDRERITRGMIAFCGLDWEDACLHPEDNRRAVVTPSLWQVRQPVYTSSIERWRNYEPWLGELAELRTGSESQV